MIATTKTTRSPSGEYRVRLFIDGVYQEGADYFTDDKRDSVETAKQMIAGACLSDKTAPEAIKEREAFDGEGVVYDVCSDYTLDEATPETIAATNWSDYIKRPCSLGDVYTHTAYNEVHYLIGRAGLAGICLY